MAEMLWTADELTAALGTDCIGVMPEDANGVSIDTRTLQPGDLYVAIKGDRTDGHKYIDKAFEAGATLAIVETGFDVPATGPLLRVADTLEALNALGRAGRARSNARIIAVTGSVGKTGTKEMLRLMLAKIGRVHASDKSYNNLWGVPLSLSRLPREADYAVFEIGMNHPGEIIPLTRMVRPHAAIITTIAPVHIEYFDGIEAIAEAKAEIFAGIEPGGAAVLNWDNEQYRLLEKRAQEQGVSRIVSFGGDSGAQARLLSATPENEGQSVRADILEQEIQYSISAPGYHLAMNSLGALTAIKLLGGDIEQAASALSDFGAPVGRGEQTLLTVADSTLLLIDEAYNANPVSMSAALKVLGSIPRERAQRRIAVLGDMLELGAHSQDLHAGLASDIEAAGIDLVFCSGPHMAALYAVLPEEKRGIATENSDELREPLLGALRPGDAIMIKGSNGSRMGPLVEAIKKRFPQRAPDTKPAAA